METPTNNDSDITLFLCGDVMTGRGVDQVLPHRCHPRLYESFATSALDYVRLAEAANGPIHSPVKPDYIWGDALAELACAAPDARIINLETAVTTSGEPVDKGINYRMHPRNIDCLTVAGVDCCVLANNHVLDWGEAGLIETLETLENAELAFAGAGRNAWAASMPAVIDLGTKGRVLVFSVGCASSGIPLAWQATAKNAGIYWVSESSAAAAAGLVETIATYREPGDVVVASIHWGSNWGYDIPAGQIGLAHALIDSGLVDIVHAHSSHHPKGIEIYCDKPVFYGCGDFINDYEGIGGYETFRGDLAVMYLVRLGRFDGRLRELRLVPYQRRRFRLNRCDETDTEWLLATLDRECGRFGGRITRREDGSLCLVTR